MKKAYLLLLAGMLSTAVFAGSKHRGYENGSVSYSPTTNRR